MPAAHRLLHHVLDGRLVDERQHLLGLGLRGREEPGAESRRRDHRLAHHAGPTIQREPYREPERPMRRSGLLRRR